MNVNTHRIPSHDSFGNRLNIGDKAAIFSKHGGIYYEGVIQLIGGKRKLVGDGIIIGGIGTCLIKKIQ